MLCLKLLAVSCFILLASAGKIPEHLKDPKHGVKMGQKDPECDDGEDSGLVDWDESPVNYTCYEPRTPLPIDKSINNLLTSDLPPEGYYPMHRCMFTKVKYDKPIPTYGSHRPNWAKFGEYKFVPPQRWLHNVEHGSVILLYHPCAMQSEVEKAKKIVRSCLFKHVITASNQLSTFRPICLVAWGHKLEMNHVDEEAIKNFIKEYGHKGPEGTLFSNGLYEKSLIKKATYPLGKRNIRLHLCPTPK